jgi:hypothetical protein
MDWWRTVDKKLAAEKIRARSEKRLANFLNCDMGDLPLMYATAPSKRVLSNDDVASAPLAAAPEALTLQNSNPDTWNARMHAFRATVGPLENMDANKLARAVLGDLDVNFSGRREWEAELLMRKEAVVAALQTAARQVRGIISLEGCPQEYSQHF